MIALRPGQPCLIHYAAKNQTPDPRWRDQRGVIIKIAKGPGPRNVLVSTLIGRVVVPRGTVIRVKPIRAERMNSA